jgi:Holliday junction resolvase
MSRLKGKQKGAGFEKKVRDFLRKKCWFVYTKGVSTPGPDILALKDGIMLLLELKTFQKMSHKQVVKLSDELYENLVRNYRFQLVKTGLKKFIIGVLIEIRGERKLYFCGSKIVEEGEIFINHICKTKNNLESWYKKVINDVA